MKLQEIQDDRTGTIVIDREREEIKTKQPPLFNVLLNNDDYISGAAVVGALQEAFAVGQQLALQIMLRAHREGRAIVGIFAKDVAETKVANAVSWIKKFHAQQGVEGDVSPYVFAVEPAE